MHDITTMVGEIREQIRASGLSLAVVSREAKVGERTLHGFILHNRIPSVRTLARLQSWLSTRQARPLNPSPDQVAA